MTCFPRVPSAANQNRRPEDPNGGSDRAQGDLVGLLGGRRPPGTTPEEALILWLLRLPDGTDPADAAAALLAKEQARDLGAADAFAGRLRDLLAEVAQYPRRRLARLHPPGRRIIHSPAPVR